jgi:hypothetical protein
LLSYLSNFKIRSVFISIKNVILNRNIEKQRFLHDETDLLPKLSDVVISDVNAIYL